MSVTARQVLDALNSEAPWVVVGAQQKGAEVVVTAAAKMPPRGIHRHLSDANRALKTAGFRTLYSRLARMVVVLGEREGRAWKPGERCSWSLMLAPVVDVHAKCPGCGKNVFTGKAGRFAPHKKPTETP